MHIFLPKILHLASWGANITTYPRSDVICFKEWLIYVNSSVTCIIIIDVCSVQKWCLLSKYTNFDKNDTFAPLGCIYNYLPPGVRVLFFKE